jgi:hypothetical protein
MISDRAGCMVAGGAIVFVDMDDTAEIKNPETMPLCRVESIAELSGRAAPQHTPSWTAGQLAAKARVGY